MSRVDQLERVLGGDLAPRRRCRWVLADKQDKANKDLM